MTSPAVPDHGITPSTISGTPGVDSSVTQESIDAAVASLRHLAGWHVWPVREDVLRVDSPGDEVIFLPTLRLVELVEVKIDGEAVSLDRLMWSDAGIVQLKSGRFPRGLGRVEVTFRHGFESPADIIGVAALMAGRTSSPGQNYSVGAISVGGASGLTPQSTEWRILDLYKLGPMP